MSTEYRKDQPDFKPFDKAEGTNYQPTTKERQGHLIGMFLSGAGKYPGVPLDPKSQEEKIMFRLGRGAGAPVELPTLQQDEHGKGFISQFTARIHALKNRHGFQIKNRVDYATNPVRSWYWVTVNEHGFPVLDNVQMVERKTGKPKSAEGKRPAESIATCTGTQNGLFSDTSAPYRDPEMQHRGTR